VHLSYDATRTNVVAEILTSQRDNSTQFSFLFDGVSQTSNTKKFDATSQTAPVKVSVVGSDGSRIDLDPIDFIWNAPAVHPLEESAGDYRSGQKGAIVEFFMWPHSEVEKECAMLAKMGYMGAKLYPAQEQVMSYETFSNDLNPWYFAYQPVSYRLQGRMGSRDQLRKAINTCRSLGGTLFLASNIYVPSADPPCLCISLFP
jgi:alpha-amylase